MVQHALLEGDIEPSFYRTLIEAYSHVMCPAIPPVPEEPGSDVIHACERRMAKFATFLNDKVGLRSKSN